MTARELRTMLDGVEDQDAPLTALRVLHLFYGGPRRRNVWYDLTADRVRREGVRCPGCGECDPDHLLFDDEEFGECLSCGVDFPA